MGATAPHQPLISLRSYLHIRVTEVLHNGDEVAPHIDTLPQLRDNLRKGEADGDEQGKLTITPPKMHPFSFKKRLLESADRGACLRLSCPRLNLIPNVLHPKPIHKTQIYTQMMGESPT